MSEKTRNESPEVQELAEVFKQFVTEVIRHSARDMVCLLRRENLSMPHVATLMYLRRASTASISEIGTYLNLSLAATSQLVDRLVGRQYVSRTEDPDDRRLKKVMLTEAGAAMVEEVMQARVEETARRLAYMPADERRNALATLELMMMYLRGEEPMNDERRTTSDE